MLNQPTSQECHGLTVTVLKQKPWFLILPFKEMNWPSQMHIQPHAEGHVPFTTQDNVKSSLTYNTISFQLLTSNDKFFECITWNIVSSPSDSHKKLKTGSVRIVCVWGESSKSAKCDCIVKLNVQVVLILKFYGLAKIR